MNNDQRLDLMVRLGAFMLSDDADWQAVRRRSSAANGWFIPEFVDLATKNIATQYLAPEALQQLVKKYKPGNPQPPARVGIVMAGNIPMVGFHDLLCTFISGHKSVYKPSSKDDVLIPFLVKKLQEWDQRVGDYIEQAEMLKGCDAYIATGSNQTAVHFEYYFRHKPHLIRKNRTSVAILTGDETDAELEGLADDVHLFFGLGCRNVTKIYVPQGYNFEKLLKVFEKYHHLAIESKYKNNYDYNLALHLLNKRPYMSNSSILLVEDASLFSPISQLHYEYYTDGNALRLSLKQNENVQAIVSGQDVPFGSAQCPGICQFADGVDTMAFLLAINEKRDEKEIRKS